MRTIGIFGGSFSPVHTGHLNVALGALRQRLAEEVWLMPCRRNPLKDGGELMADSKRLDLLKKAVGYYKEETEGRIRICDMELSMPMPSYTSDTLRRLQSNYPDCNFRLICGADSYLGFKRWKDWQWIEENFNPVVYPRPGYEIEELRPNWTMLEGVTLSDISSTRLRQLQETGDELQNYMPWIK